jgi:hypothetical protein
MAKNVQGVIFLRNGNLYESRQVALNRVATAATSIADGQAILARYTDADDENKVKTIVGFKYSGASSSYLTLIDVEGLKGDAKALVDALRTEIDNKLGNGVTAANTATAQLAALSGGTFDPGASSSADTSVEGAKAYAYSLIGTLDYTDTAETGKYVSEVTQSDGKIISTTKVELPSVTGQAESKKVVISVSEDKGTVSDAKGTISSSAGTIVLNDNTDGGIDFDVNIDGTSIVKDANGVLSVASTALTQYSGDNVTINVSAADANNNKTISSLLTIEKVTTSVPETVAHRFQLAGSDHVKIGEYIDIPKDSALVNFYLGHVDDLLQGTTAQTEEGSSATVVPGTGDTALVWIMLLNDGKYKLTAVNVESFIEEAEFASGVTWDSTAKKVKGVVDPTSEKDSQATPVDFLTVGADGFKVSGIKDEIDRQLDAVVEDLDADISGNSTHVTVGVVEEDGVITAVTVSEDNIADADDLAALSAKTVTEIASSNASISAVSSSTTDSTVKYDIVTDADKIKMSGFTFSGTSSFSGITNDDTIADAFDKANAVITENERITAAALNDLNDKIEAVSGASLSGVSVNNVALTKTNNAVNVQISGSTAAPSGTLNGPAIIVTTDNSTGAVTIGLGYIDCGTYDDE